MDIWKGNYRSDCCDPFLLDCFILGRVLNRSLVSFCPIGNVGGGGNAGHHEFISVSEKLTFFFLL
jgi:hypothetical protein